MVTTPTPLSIAQMYGYSSLHQADLVFLGVFSWGVPVLLENFLRTPHRIFISVVARVVLGYSPFLFCWSLVWLLGGQSAFSYLKRGAIMGACYGYRLCNSPISSKVLYFGLGAGAITGSFVFWGLPRGSYQHSYHECAGSF